ncbi:CPCC family cysteine-rich protein [Kitasatospora sp. NPDC097605]|uniref:CPCC family cysteine-rich protein n=1 Tax=Kitasatospora sp. NPDC097605 TaxID=3157226 RepID=UPI0033284DE6
MDTRRPCTCCGHLVLDADDGWPGSYAICPVCSWEDDPVRLRRPFTPGGADRPSLVEAQRNFRAYGACDQRGRRFARPATEEEPLDADWYPIDPRSDRFEGFEDFEDADSGPRRPRPDDLTVLCWWLPSFWGPGEPEPDPERRVVIDVGAVQDDHALHAVLKRELGFPSFYGMNWNAFWDAITGLVTMPRELHFTGWPELERRCPGSAAQLRRQLTDLADARPGYCLTSCQ